MLKRIRLWLRYNPLTLRLTQLGWRLRQLNWRFQEFTAPNVEKLKAKRDVKGLIKALAYQKSWDTQVVAARALGAIGDARAVEPLIAALKHKEYLGVVAAEALGKLKDRRAVEPLVAALNDPHFPSKHSVVEALGEISDTQAISPLVAALKDRETLVRATAARALGKIRDERVIVSLTVALKDYDSMVRKSVADTLDSLDWQPSDDTQRAALAVARQQWDQVVTLGAAAVEPLIIALRDENKYEREEAAKALGKIGDPQAVKPLIEALGDQIADVREAAAQALGQIGGARAVQPLVVTLNDQNAKVRQAAAQALEQIGDTQSIEPLVALFERAEGRTRETIERVLQSLGWQPTKEQTLRLAVKDHHWDQVVKFGTEAIKPLTEVLKDKKGNVRLEAVKTLGEIGGKQAIKPLIAALKDEDRDVQQAAARALKEIGHGAVAPLITVLKTDKSVHPEVVNVLGQIGDPRAVEPLIATLGSSKNKDVRQASAKALGQIGDPQAVEPLLTALNDKTEVVRQAAAQALGKIGDARAVTPLLAVLKDGHDDERSAAVEALGKIGDSQAIPPLIEALSSVSVSSRHIDADSEFLDKAVGALSLLDPHWAESEAGQQAQLVIARGLNTLLETPHRHDPDSARALVHTLMKYLASVIAYIPTEDLRRLTKLDDVTLHYEEFSGMQNVLKMAKSFVIQSGKRRGYVRK